MCMRRYQDDIPKCPPNDMPHTFAVDKKYIDCTWPDQLTILLWQNRYDRCK